MHILIAIILILWAWCFFPKTTFCLFAASPFILLMIFFPVGMFTFVGAVLFFTILGFISTIGKKKPADKNFIRLGELAKLLADNQKPAPNETLEQTQARFKLLDDIQAEAKILMKKNH